MEIIFENLIRHMNVAWRIESFGEGVVQVGECEIALSNIEFKRKCHICGKYGHEQNKCPKKNKSEEKRKQEVYGQV